MFIRKFMIAACILFGSMPDAQAEELNHFLGMEWGENILDIATSFDREGVNAQSTLGVDMQIEGLDTHVSYIFESQKLVAGTLEVTEPRYTLNAVVQDFETIQSAMKKLYGGPDSVRDVWLKNDYRSSARNRYLAFLQGHLYRIAEWSGVRGDFALVLRGKDFEMWIEGYASSKNIGATSRSAEAVSNPD